MNSILDNENFKKDKYLFSLVGHNLNVDNYKIISDGENYAFVIGRENKDIWIWSKNNLDEQTINNILEILDSIIIDKDYSFICKPDLYNILKDKCDYINEKPFIYDNYVCKTTIVPKKTDGILCKPTVEDKETIAKFWKENCEHFGYNTPIELCLRFAETWINSNTFYTWKVNNKVVSFLGFDIIDDTAEISHAYTDPNERGKGYMQNLIYSVTEQILKSGLKPVLNTDYSYESSNNAYKKVGFEETELIYSFSTSKHKLKAL